MDLSLIVGLVIISLVILVGLLDCFLTAKYDREPPKYMEYFDKPIPIAPSVPFIIIIEKREEK